VCSGRSILEMQPGRNYVAAHKVEPSPEESPPCWAAKVF